MVKVVGKDSSRRRVVDGRLEKVNPDYLIYLKESYATETQSDPIWNETVKASIDVAIL